MIQCKSTSRKKPAGPPIGPELLFSDRGLVWGPQSERGVLGVTGSPGQKFNNEHCANVSAPSGVVFKCAGHATVDLVKKRKRSLGATLIR